MNKGWQLHAVAGLQSICMTYSLDAQWHTLVTLQAQLVGEGWHLLPLVTCPIPSMHTGTLWYFCRRSW